MCSSDLGSQGTGLDAVLEDGDDEGGAERVRVPLGRGPVAPRERQGAERPRVGRTERGLEQRGAVLDSERRCRMEVSRASDANRGGLGIRPQRRLRHEAVEQLAEVQRQAELAYARRARVLRALDCALEVFRDRLHVVVELPEHGLEPALGPRARQPGGEMVAEKPPPRP